MPFQFPSKAPRWRLRWDELRNSLMAVLALGLALSTSLVSSVAASEGKFLVAVWLAVIALFLALIVTITVVPRLLRKVRREWLWSSCGITREGWVYFLALLIIASAAFNTGNNLLFIVLSAALALLVVSEALTTINLRRLDLRVDLPEYVPAKERFAAVLQLRNLKSWFPAFSLTMGCAIQSDFRKQRGETKGLTLAYLPFLGSGRQFKQAVSLQLAHRGLHSIKSLEVRTRFPFGFVNRRRKIPDTREIIALPEVEPSNEFLDMLPRLSGAFESLCRGWGSDLHSIREYSPRDSARFLDWKASAKAGRLLVREFTKEDDRKCCFVFDNAIPNHQGADEPVFEKAVRVCANAVRHFHQRGCEIRLVTAGHSTSYSKSEEGLLEILKILALVQPVALKEFTMSELGEERAFKLWLTARPQAAVPSWLWSSSHIVCIREWCLDQSGIEAFQMQQLGEHSLERDPTSG
jgi:uncharacterized protein (DUF58 family)